MQVRHCRQIPGKSRTGKVMRISRLLTISLLAMLTAIFAGADRGFK